jgi:hypothetical protein
MSNVIIKSVKRKTTVSKAAIKKAARIAYALPQTAVTKSTSKKNSKAA